MYDIDTHKWATTNSMPKQSVTNTDKPCTGWDGICGGFEPESVLNSHQKSKVFNDPISGYGCRLLEVSCYCSCHRRSYWCLCCVPHRYHRFVYTESKSTNQYHICCLSCVAPSIDMYSMILSESCDACNTLILINTEHGARAHPLFQSWTGHTHNHIQTN